MRVAAGAVLGAALGAAVAAAADEAGVKDPGPLVFMTEERPPNNYLDPKSGEIKGTSVDTLRALLDRLGWRAEFKLEAWSRSYALALTEPKTCVFSTARIGGRDALFKWVGPIDITRFVILASAKSGIKLSTLDDARPYRIGVYTQDVREMLLRQQGGYLIDVAASDPLNARKLVEGRIDLWFTSLEAFEQTDASLREQMTIVFRQEPLPIYLACNAGFADETIYAMNQALIDLGLMVEVVKRPK